MEGAETMAPLIRMVLFPERQSSGLRPNTLDFGGFREADSIEQQTLFGLLDNIHSSLLGEKASVIFFL